MRYLFKCVILILAISLLGCGLSKEPVKEIPLGYEVQKGTDLAVILQTPLSSNINQRGDTFSARLKEPLIYKKKVILPRKTEIRGLVKRVVKIREIWRSGKFAAFI